MHGSGNDFVVVDNRERVVPPDDVAAFARAVCRPQLGLGADGVVLIGDGPGGVDCRWRYINADGTDGAVGGDGAMCGVGCGAEMEVARRSCRQEPPAGVMTAQLHDDGRTVTVDMI